jgi:rSAM/selenodomain-associated transferase 2
VISVVMPAYNEERALPNTLRALFTQQGDYEVIVVDGGSRDDTVKLAQPLADMVIVAPRGRAAQMNAGAGAAHGGVLIFLHADTQLPPDADRLICEGLGQRGRVWGRFDIRIPGGPLLTLVGLMMNLRSRLTGICTGDQAIFVTRAVFNDIGGYPPIALMEDIALTARLRRIGAPLCLPQRAVTSPRRWLGRGVLATIVLMWRLRLAYYFGADPATLARRYGYAPADP